MKVCIITGSAGLIGSEAVDFFSTKFDKIIGVDNDMRKTFFGPDASTESRGKKLTEKHKNYTHFSEDICDHGAILRIFQGYKSAIKLIIHTAAQPSHDLAAQMPNKDFQVNAVGTLNLLEITRLLCPEAVFIFTSTNKVYGDRPNELPLVELDTRYELPTTHDLWNGLPEEFPIDQCKHSLFGVSKLSADLMVQEYGRYFGMNTGVFRGGCLTGPNHAGTQMHGFLSYLMKCAVVGQHYTINGYKGKQVRDNIHSYDLIAAFWESVLNPPSPGSVFNMGGSRHANISMIEAINWLENRLGYNIDYSIDNAAARKGDHIWYISDVRKFQQQYPSWKYTYSIEDVLGEMVERLINSPEKNQLT